MRAPRFNRIMNRVWAWFRWQAALIESPPTGAKDGGFQPSRWTGAFVLVAIAYQVVSGGLLLLYYQPSVNATLTLCGQTAGTASPSPAAWCSTYYIVHSIPMGGLLLTTHLYGAYAVIFLMLVHLFGGYYRGGYRRPGRKFSWVVGIALLVLTLGMGFTGYLLPYTQLSYNATEVSITLVQSLPLVGVPFAQLMVGDGTPQSLLSRMFAAHVILLPVAIVVLVFLHKRTTLFPHIFLNLAKWGMLYIGVLLGVASLWTWQLPTYAGNATGAPPATVPAWYFLWLFKLVDFVGVTPEDAMLFTVVVLLFLLFLPFIDRSRRQRVRDRPVFLFLGNSLVGFFVLMTVWGGLTPGLPIPPIEVAVRLGPVLAANALAVAFFYTRYRKTRASPGASDRPTLEPPGAVAPGPPDARMARAPAPAEEPLLPAPAFLLMIGLLGSLFLLAFGLVLPFVFLLAAFLVGFADSARSPPIRRNGPSRTRPEEWTFSVVAAASVVFLLAALVLTVLA